MGAGYHGGFGSTAGSHKTSIITADSYLVGSGHGSALKEAAKKVKKEPGFTDVAVHGSPDNITVFRKNANGSEEAITLDQRRLAKFLKADKGYTNGKIRLLSCKTGDDKGAFAQNLANKMGVVVRAPSDTLHIWPNGKMIIGPDPYTNSGKWIDYYPRKGK